MVDVRSDENLVIAQMHVLFAKFHNRVLDLLKNQPALSAGPVGASLFERLNPPTEKGYRKHRHHQYLTRDIGHPALNRRLYELVGMARASTDWNQFYRLVDRTFPRVNTTPQLALDDWRFGFPMRLQRFNTRNALNYSECDLCEVSLRLVRRALRFALGFWHLETVPRISTEEHSKLKLTHYRFLT